MLQSWLRRPRPRRPRRRRSSTAHNVRVPPPSPSLFSLSCTVLTEHPTVGAHQNTLESLPQVISATLIVGLKYPYLAAGVCGVWTVARLFYTIGYSSGDPERRNLFGAMAVNGLTTLRMCAATLYSTRNAADGGYLQCSFSARRRTLPTSSSMLRCTTGCDE